jgi:vacuolar-type H+-ATPase subunit E/Vma4
MEQKIKNTMYKLGYAGISLTSAGFVAVNANRTLRNKFHEIVSEASNELEQYLSTIPMEQQDKAFNDLIDENTMAFDDYYSYYGGE